MEQLAEFEVEGHILRPLHAPEIRLQALLSLINEAQESIKLVIYIYKTDQTGQEIRDALVAAARRGVAIKLIIDSFGSSDTTDEFFAPLVAAGGQYVWFSSKWNLGYFIRTHQKIVIADRKRAVVGGFNIADSYFGRAGDKSWEDFGLEISGEKVEQLAAHVDELFSFCADGGIKFRKLRQIIKQWRSGSGTLQWLIGGPTNRLSPWAMQLKKDLESAKQIDMVCAYFTPTTGVLRRIAKVTRANEAGHIILAGKTDNGATIGASRGLYKYLINRGARLFEFQPRPLHMKLLVLDDASYIGSANLDVRSLFINMEIMLRIEDRALADHLRALVAKMAAESEEQTLAVHNARTSWFSRLRWALAYLLVGSIDYTIGRRIKFRELRARLAKPD